MKESSPHNGHPAPQGKPLGDSSAHEAPSAWRSLEELAQTPEFEERLHREFPRHASEWDASLDRRNFLSLSGAALGLAGLTACSKQPPEKIVPYVLQPEEIVPGNPLFFATTGTFAGYGVGLLAESHQGRPTKVEGNPEHPASLGGTDLYAQASILDLYDPHRSPAILNLGKIGTWSAFVDEVAIVRSAMEALEGEGLRILTGTVTSPTLAWMFQRLAEAMPKAQWHQFEPAGRDAVRKGAEMAFGEVVEVTYDFTKADVVLAVDSDFLHEGPAAVRYSKDFSSRRQIHDPGAATDMSRLYTVDSTPTGTSSVADHRLTLKPSEVGHFVCALAAKLGVAGVSAPSGFGGEEKDAWIEELAKDLQAANHSVVVPGEYTSPELQALCHAINDHLGNLGTTVLTTDPVAAGPTDQAASFEALVADMNAGAVDTLVILGANPLYGHAGTEEVAAALGNVRLRVQLGTHVDETTPYCHWHVPQAHYLEAWGDARCFDGTASITQPLIEPLYGGKSDLEIMAVLLGEATKGGDDLLQEYWATQQTGDAGKAWRRSLHDGLVVDTAFEPRPVTLAGGVAGTASQALTAIQPSSFELVFRPDPTIFDGRFSNNGWLQECPKPITKLTWDNALLISPATARELGFPERLVQGDQDPKAPMAQVTAGGQTLEVPIWVTPGHANNVGTLNIGYGRPVIGKADRGEGDGPFGFDVNPLRQGDVWSSEATVTPGAGIYRLASTQDHHSMEGRHMVRHANLEDYLHDPEHAGAPHLHVDPTKSMMDGKDFPYDGYAWGMTLDLTSCTGCNACLMACNAENNQPVVGKDQVMMGREMHWIRVDRYFMGDADHVTEVVNQPVPCMQCEQAPCEVVCPVAATVHSDEGLNDMIYNRCVGTRYCSNNCPYKVRRFNFLLYQDFETPSLQLSRNPDVTVRSRGVMEKCTYCVQRINHARIVAKREDRKIVDGEIVTACQGACPSNAIAFGDINDSESQVSKMKASPMNFSLLEELGTRPRTTYIGRVRNPNPSLLKKIAPAGESHDGDHHGAGH